MFELHLDTMQDVDFTILTKRLHKTEKRSIDLLTNEQQEELVKGRYITFAEMDEYRRKVLAQNKTLTWKTNCTLSKTDAQLHALAKFYEKGIIKSEGYTVVRINLATAIVDIIALISRIEKYRKCDLSKIHAQVARLFSGLVEDDFELQDSLTDLLELGNPLLSTYIDKALSRDNSTVIVEPLFSMKYEYKNISKLEGIILPISLSLNMLSYAIVGNLFNHFRRGEKRFICVDKHSIYYHVRDDVVDYFKGGKYFIDNMPIDITFEEFKFPLSK